jgi:hypothetical protein
MVLSPVATEGVVAKNAPLEHCLIATLAFAHGVYDVNAASWFLRAEMDDGGLR